MRWGVLFDMDGVLLPTPAVNLTTFLRVLDAAGVSPGPDALLPYVGRRLEDQVESLNAAFGLALRLEDVEREVRAGQAKLLRDLIPDLALVRLLRALHQMGAATGVATSSPRGRMSNVITALGVTEWLGTSVCAEDVTQGKPDPECFVALARRLDVPPQSCVVIEDAAAGVAAAHAAGMRCVAIRAAWNRADDLAGADLVVNSVHDLTAADLYRLAIRP